MGFRGSRIHLRPLRGLGPLAASGGAGALRRTRRIPPSRSPRPHRIRGGVVCFAPPGPVIPRERSDRGIPWPERPSSQRIPWPEVLSSRGSAATEGSLQAGRGSNPAASGGTGATRHGGQWVPDDPWHWTDRVELVVAAPPLPHAANRQGSQTLLAAPPSTAVTPHSPHSPAHPAPPPASGAATRCPWR